MQLFNKRESSLGTWEFDGKYDYVDHEVYVPIQSFYYVLHDVTHNWFGNTKRLASLIMVDS
jgi:hypothetical protein